MSPPAQNPRFGGGDPGRLREKVHLPGRNTLTLQPPYGFSRSAPPGQGCARPSRPIHDRVRKTCPGLSSILRDMVRRWKKRKATPPGKVAPLLDVSRMSAPLGTSERDRPEAEPRAAPLPGGPWPRAESRAVLSCGSLLGVVS